MDVNKVAEKYTKTMKQVYAAPASDCWYLQKSVSQKGQNQMH